MIADLRGGILLATALLYFLFALALLTLGTFLRPGRWCERVKTAG